MPCDYKKYPPNWKELRKQVLERADNKCEFCGVENGAIGWRDADGKFIYAEDYLKAKENGVGFYITTGRLKIVLTIAHLDHDEENHEVSIERLKALCQKCHLQYDIQEKKKRRKNKKAIGDLFK